MVETYYVEALAAKIGADVGDIANELALVFTTVSYLPLRTLELKYVGRLSGIQGGMACVPSILYTTINM